MPVNILSGYTMAMTGDLVARVRAYILQHTLISAGDTAVVAVSGGADSLCLLHVLHRLVPHLDCRLHVAHLDHAMRDAAAEDAAFVAACAAELGLPCTVERRDVAALARQGRMSLETAARMARYDFLRGVMAAEDAAAIATGHTRDDQAETVLMHLARGSGLSGLAGMRPRHDGIIRPLLAVSHAETVAYCAAVGLAPRDDKSNRSPAHRRNRVRHEVLPRLDAIQPAASANVARAARLLAADLALIERLAQRALDHAIVEHAGAGVVLSAARWAQAEPELRPHMARLLLVRLRGHATGFEERHYAALARALDPVTPATSITLPRGLILTRHVDKAMLSPPAAAPAPLGDYTLAWPGRVQTEAGLLCAAPATAPSTWTGVPAHTAYLDPLAAGDTLAVRAWRSGDRVQPLGMAGTRKVQDILVDRKVPRAVRSRIPIVEGARGIAWVAGLCVGEPYRVAAGAAALRLTWDARDPDRRPQS